LFKKILVRKLCLSVIFAFVCSGGLFFLLQQISAHQIEDKYRNEAFVEQAMQQEVAELQYFITDNNISIQNYYKISQWVDGNKIIALSLYYKDSLIYDSSIPYKAEEFYAGIKHQPPAFAKLYPIYFKDAEALVDLTAYLKHYAYDISLIRNVCIFFLIFLSIVLSYIHRKTAYILILEQKVLLMQGGKLDTTIPVKGNDEISSLAENINIMQQKFIEQIHAQEANKKYASTMAHDIRTPLSALIGYLDILIHNRTKDESKQRQYLIKSAEKADQLKTLTEQLFESLIISNHEHMTGHEGCIDRTTLEILIYDCVFLLESDGFHVKVSLNENTEYQIHIHREPMQRVLDNLVSNIFKYADKENLVKINISMDERHLLISVLNTVNVNSTMTSGTGLGIRTCQDLLEEHGSTLIIDKSNTNYEVILKILLD
jgi:signal transduction histidine kinase